MQPTFFRHSFYYKITLSGLQQANKFNAYIPDQCVDFRDLDAIQFVDSHLYLRLVGTLVNNKH